MTLNNKGRHAGRLTVFDRLLESCPSEKCWRSIKVSTVGFQPTNEDSSSSASTKSSSLVLIESGETKRVLGRAVSASRNNGQQKDDALDLHSA